MSFERWAATPHGQNGRVSASPSSRGAPGDESDGPTAWWRRLSIRSLADPRGFRLRVAVLMAFISLASAYTTHVATAEGSAAAGLHGAASQQWAQEQQVEQQIDAWVAQDLRLTARVDEHIGVWWKSDQAAAVLRERDPAAAAQLDLQAQGSIDSWRQLLPFYRAAAPTIADGTAAYDSHYALDALRIMDPRLYRASSDVTREAALTASSRARSTVLVVVLLVAGLFILTLAHLGDDQRGPIFAAAGALTAVAAVVWMAISALHAALPLIVGGAVLVGVLILLRSGTVSRLLGGLEEQEVVPQIIGASTQPGSTVAVDPDAPPAGFRRFVAIAIASVTLIGAVVGYLQKSASDESDAASWRARDLGVQSIGALRAAEEEMTVAVEMYQLALLERVNGWNATQRADYASSVSDGQRVEMLRREAVQWDELATRTEERSGVSAVLGSSGVSSEVELRRLRAEVWAEAARLAGLQDAANAESRSAGERAATYIAVLAWLAVAVYMLGLSLVFRGRPVRILLPTVGVLLILVSAVQTGAAWIGSGTHSPDAAERAAEAYAAGVVAMQRGEAQEAIQHLDRAIELRPDFGLARLERSQAILEESTVRGLGIRSVFTPEAVDSAIEDLTRARENGTETAGVVLNLGAMLFHRAVHDDTPADLTTSAELSELGLELGEAFTDRYSLPHVNQIIGESNLGLVLTGLADVTAAEDAYSRMSADTRQLPPRLRPYLADTALTTLEILSEAPDPPPESEIRRMKELVVGSVFGVADDSPARIGLPASELFPATLQWRATITDFDPERDVLVAHWYRYDDRLGRWHGLPRVSGPLTLGVPDVGGIFHRDTIEDRYWGNNSGLLQDVPPTCTPSGRYKLELYLNGRLEAVQPAEWAGAEYTPILARDVGVAMCQPPEWSRANEVPGRSTGMASPDGSRGLVVFRVHQPIAQHGTDGRPATVQRLLANGLDFLPELVEPGVPLDAFTQATVFGSNGGLWQWHTYLRGVAKTATTWTAQRSGTVLVTILYGPEEWIESAEAQAIILALTEH